MIENLVRTENKKNIHSAVQCVAVWILLPGAAAPLATSRPMLSNAVMNLWVLHKVGSSITS
jgi:hypothetical protein